MTKPLPLLRHFRKLQDPRINRRKLHSLEAVLVIALCAVIAAAEDFQQIALFGRKRKGWLERFLALPNGTPSHDTFERLFATRLVSASSTRWPRSYFGPGGCYGSAPGSLGPQ